MRVTSLAMLLVRDRFSLRTAISLCRSSLVYVWLRTRSICPFLSRASPSEYASPLLASVSWYLATSATLTCSFETMLIMNARRTWPMLSSSSLSVHTSLRCCSGCALYL